ncbi:MAG: fumarylacetoacetate hydrolase family protein [Acidimicrobiales bacterium]
MKHPLGLSPTKIIAVHLNYKSRASQRGRFPENSSYFLKPPSALSSSGQDIVRPRGAELLAFEGEIAVILARQAYRVDEQEGFACIAGYAAANDVGLYDLRECDAGSNVRAKGQDSFAPIGPTIIPFTAVDPSDISLRTWVNGELRQEDSSRNLLFSFGRVIADLSRLMTLEEGDIILTGTPAGAGLLEPGDVVEVEIGESGRLSNRVIESDHDLEAFGAMPKPTAALRVAAAGDSTTHALLKADTRTKLQNVSTATLSSQLRKRGLNNMFIEGVSPTRPEMRMIGTAFTLRYLPHREDLFAQLAPGMNAQKRAIDNLQEGQVLVIDCRRERGAGTIGDILALRALRRGAAGVVTDGCVRDSPSFSALDLPVYHAGAHAAVLGRRHVPVDFGGMVSCGDVLIRPGDVLVGDAEGVIVIPMEIVDEVAAAADEQEEEERFIYERVGEGESIDGLYPLSKARRPEFEAWRESRGKTP